MQGTYSGLRGVECILLYSEGGLDRVRVGEDLLAGGDHCLAPLSCTGTGHPIPERGRTNIFWIFSYLSEAVRELFQAVEDAIALLSCIRCSHGGPV